MSLEAAQSLSVGIVRYADPPSEVGDARFGGLDCEQSVPRGFRMAIAETNSLEVGFICYASQISASGAARIDGLHCEQCFPRVFLMTIDRTDLDDEDDYQT